MFVFQVAQKNAQQEGQAFQPQVKIYTNKAEVQRIMQGVAGVSEQIFSKVHNKPDAF